MVDEENPTEQEMEMPIETPVKLKITIPVVIGVGETPTLTNASFAFECSRHHFTKQLNTLMLQLGTLLNIVGPPWEAPP